MKEVFWNKLSKWNFLYAMHYFSLLFLFAGMMLQQWGNSNSSGSSGGTGGVVGV